MTAVDFRVVNPNTETAPVFRTPADAVLTRLTYALTPVLLDKTKPSPAKVWPVEYTTTFHMASDSGAFVTVAQLTTDGCYPVADGHWRKGSQDGLPLYEGKVVQAFNHRAASIRREEANLHRAAQPVSASGGQLVDPAWTPITQFYVESRPALNTWTVVMKDVTSVTNARTVIASLIPSRAAGHTLPLLELAKPLDRTLLVTTLNSFPYDYFARQKVQKNHLAWFIVEQLPVIPPAAYDRAFGPLTAREIVQREVLHLSYNANDMAAFARDPGHDGAPFAWDEAARQQRRARLDALYFHLYGLDATDADYILSTIPIVRRHDEAAYGRFSTRDLILGHLAALAAGDPNAVICLAEQFQ